LIGITKPDQPEVNVLENEKPNINKIKERFGLLTKTVARKKPNILMTLATILIISFSFGTTDIQKTGNAGISRKNGNAFVFAFTRVRMNVKLSQPHYVDDQRCG